jgi:hypothetical protein
MAGLDSPRTTSGAPPSSPAPGTPTIRVTANADGISGSVEGHENLRVRLNRAYRRWQGANGASAVPAPRAPYGT